LAAAKPWKAKLLLGVVWLLRNVNDEVEDGGDEVVVVLLMLPPLPVVAAGD
jgi:hypothetical protein